MKKRPERLKHCAPAAVPHRRTESAMAVVRQSQNFRVIMVTDTARPPSHPPQTHTHRQDRLQYTAPQLASAQYKHSRSGLAWSRPRTDRGLSRLTSAFRTKIGVCKILSRSVQIWQYTRVENPFWSKNRERPSLRLVKVKGKASSLDIAPLTILNSGTFTTSEVAADWH